MEQLYEQIEAYLKGTLSTSQKAVFEGQMAANGDLAKEVRLHGLLQGEMGDVEKVALRTQLEEIGGTFDLSFIEAGDDFEVDDLAMEEGLFVVENLDDFLQNIVKEALMERTPPNPRLERKRLALVKSSVATEVVHPKTDVLCSDSIHFELGEASQQAVRLVLQNAKGKSMGIFQIPANQVTYTVSLADAILFPSGVYYWTLILEGVPVVGRFFVCREEDVEGMVN